MSVVITPAALDLRVLERAFAQGIKVRRLSAKHWQASSSAGDGTLYELTVEPGCVSCTCPAGGVGRSCKHAALVLVLAASGAVPVPDLRPHPGDTAMLAHERRIGRHFHFDDPDDLPF